MGSFLSSVGFGGETGDTKGALEEIGRRPFGGTLLVILAVGLLQYSAWKFVEAFKDPEDIGKNLRVLYGASGFLHIYLAYMAARTVLSGLGVMGGGQSGDQSAQSGTSWLMSQWFGRWLVGVVGVVAFGISISQLLVAYRAKFREKLALRDMHAWEKIAMIILGRMGFCVRLPTMSPAADPIAPVETAKQSAQPSRVLVVDDNMDAADMLVMMLQMFGHEVRAAYSGQTALETAVEYQPDVVLLDIGLPDMNGYEVARHLRQHHKQKM